MPTKVADRPKTNQTRKPIAARANGKSAAARRGSSSSAAASSAVSRLLRANLHWLFLAAGAIVLGALLYVAYQKLTASSLFALRSVDVGETTRTDAAAIENLVRIDAAKSGVWNANLSQIRQKLENNQDEQFVWIKSAVVSRVLPDTIRVRTIERVPRVVVKLENNKFVWIDDEARALGAANLNENQFGFVLTNWSEPKDTDGLKRNQERFKFAERLRDEWRNFGVVERVKAVNLADSQDVEVVVEQNGVQIPIQIGNKNFGEHLKAALTELEIKARNSDLNSIQKIINYGGYSTFAYKTNQPNAVERKESPAKAQKGKAKV